MKSLITLHLTALALLAMVLSGCKKDAIEKTYENKEYIAGYTRHDPEESDAFHLFNKNLLTYPLPEASGLVSGRKNPGLIYIHEDSGNRPVVFVYDTLGTFLGEIVLAGVNNRDWEDIAIGPGPETDVSYIYVGDIGDNKSVREELMIHRFPEPDITLVPDSLPFKIILTGFSTIKYRYPDGPRDAETLMIDPATKDLIIITKREVNVHVYRLLYPQAVDNYTPVFFKGKLPFRTIVGGDISPDGKEILIKDYGRIYHWKVSDDIMGTLFWQTPSMVAYIPEVQGEAIGWTADGTGYFTTTETDKHQADPILYHYRRR